MLSTQFSSISFLANWQTKLVYFLINPLIDLLLLVLIDMQYTNNFNWSVVIASITIDAALLSLQTINELLVKDSGLRIDFELVAKRPFSWRYWLTKAFVAIFIGLSLALINLLLAGLFGAPLNLIYRGLILLPLVCLYGTIFGFAAWSMSWQMNDPYFWQNIFNTLLKLLAGILVVISHYPTWLKYIAYLFPFSGSVNFIKLGSADLTSGVFLTAAWLGVGVVAYVLQIRPILAKGKHHY